MSVAFSRSLHSSRSLTTQYAAVIITSYMQCAKGCTDKTGYNGQVKVLCPKCFNEFVYLWKSVVKLMCIFTYVLEQTTYMNIHMVCMVSLLLHTSHM